MIYLANQCKSWLIDICFQLLIKLINIVIFTDRSIKRIRSWFLIRAWLSIIFVTVHLLMRIYTDKVIIIQLAQISIRDILLSDIIIVIMLCKILFVLTMRRIQILAIVFLVTNAYLIKNVIFLNWLTCDICICV
jgi:hypothetical protein